MSHQLLQAIAGQYLKTDLPTIYPGDTVRVKVKIIEGKKERIQAYEGLVIRRSGSSTSATITVRRVFQGVGIERTFLIHSPKVDSIAVLRRGDVRRARLYYMRERAGKSARIREKINAALPVATPAKVPVAEPTPTPVVEAPVADVAAPEATTEA